MNTITQGFGQQNNGEIRDDMTSPSLLDEFDPLLATKQPIHSAPQQQQYGVPASSSAAHNQRQQSLVQPILELERHVRPPMLSQRQSSEAQISPTSAQFNFESGSPPHTLSRRLSGALEDYAGFISHHHPAPPSTSATNTLKTSTSKNMRPGLAALFKDAPWNHINEDSSAIAQYEKPAPFFDGAPGFSSRPTTHFSPPHSQPGSPAPPQPIHLSGFRPDFQPVLSIELAESIRPSLPPRLRLSEKWTLLYSLDLHGVSLSTLYDRVKAGMAGGGCGCVLVIKDSNGTTFGGFVNEALKPQETYYGSGECFLWKAQPFGPGDFRVGIGVKAFKWTGKNTYMVLCDHQYISLGGGEGKFGLWIDQAFEKGSSAPCLTYDNEVLCSTATQVHTNLKRIANGYHDAAVRFEVNRVEVWRV